MAKQPTGIIIRFANDINNWPAGQPVDAGTNAPVVIPTGADLLLQMFFTQGAPSEATKVDYTHIATVYVALQTTGSPHNGTVYWSRSLANGNINNTCTYADWLAGANQQISLTVPAALNAFQAPQGQQNYWLVIYGVTDDATPRQIVFCATKVSVLDSGLPLTAPPLSPSFQIGTKLSFQCADAQTRNVTLIQDGGVWTFSIDQTGNNGPGQTAYSLYCADGMWRDLKLVLDGTEWTLEVVQDGHS